MILLVCEMVLLMKHVAGCMCRDSVEKCAGQGGPVEQTEPDPTVLPDRVPGRTGQGPQSCR